MNISDPSSRRSSLTARNPGLLPSPLPREASAATTSTTTSTEASGGSHPAALRTAAAVADATAHLQPGASETLEADGGEGTASVRPAFAPFFTLVEDARTATTTHPAVRYIFSDDDSDVLTDALLRLNAPQRAQTAASDRTVGATTTARSGSRPPTAADTTERAVVVTLGADGRSVLSAHSLTPDWQVLGAEVAAAPTLEGEEGETGGLMLRIQGTEGFRADSNHAIVLEAGGVDGAVERFRERMEELRRVVDAGAQRPGGSSGAVGLS